MEIVNLPNKIDKKNNDNGILTIGDAILRNQFGVIGNKRNDINNQKRLPFFCCFSINFF